MNSREEAVMFRLYLVRQLLNESLQLIGDTFPLSRMKVILSLDHAIEILLATILPILGIKVDRNWGIPKMLEELSSCKSPLQSHQTPIERLRRLRDRVQHDGVIPSLEDVRQYAVQAEVFVRDTIREVLGKELEELSPIELINDTDVREHLRKAELALQDHDNKTAVKEAAIGFEIGWRKFKVQLINQGVYFSRADQIANELARAIGEAAEEAAKHIYNPTIEEFARKLKWELNSFRLRDVLAELTEPFELSQYGIDIKDYVRFKQIAPYVNWTLGSNEPLVTEPPNWSPKQSDALFALDFVCTAILQLQKRRDVREATKYDRDVQ